LLRLEFAPSIASWELSIKRGFADDRITMNRSNLPQIPLVVEKLNMSSATQIRFQIMIPQSGACTNSESD
jgi:hypothetical protein